MDCDAEVRYIQGGVLRFVEGCPPVISVDTKQKELVGEVTNRGQEWHAKGNGPDVLTFDFRQRVRHGTSAPVP